MEKVVRLKRLVEAQGWKVEEKSAPDGSIQWILSLEAPGGSGYDVEVLTGPCPEDPAEALAERIWNTAQAGFSVDLYVMNWLDLKFSTGTGGPGAETLLDDAKFVEEKICELAKEVEKFLKGGIGVTSQEAIRILSSGSWLNLLGYGSGSEDEAALEELYEALDFAIAALGGN